MSLIGSTRVPFEGPDEYNLLLVGEAPGGEEAGQGRPFVGEAGQFLRRYLGRKGCEIPIGEIKFANLSKHRPADNKFGHLLGTIELERGLEELKEEILRVRPNLTVALGNWPLWYLTGMCGTDKGKPNPGAGISLYRGSLIPAKEEFGGGKVLCSYHPSYIKRPGGYKWNPVFFMDLCRAAGDRHFPELRYTEFEEHIDPPKDVLRTLVEESMEAEWCAVDIETFPKGVFSCIGWAYKRPQTGKFAGVCVTFQAPHLWGLVQALWESPAPKIFQYGTYDVGFMQHFNGWKVGGFYDGVGWDTYVAAAQLFPEYPRRLDFLASIMTRFPFWKEERKVWKQTGDMTTLWRYNLKDCVATYEIAEYQMEAMRRHYAQRRS